MDNPSFIPAVTYRDPEAALKWLENAFGFEITMAIRSPDGDPSQSHFEMSNEGRGTIMIGGEWADWTRSPASNDGFNTATVHVSVSSDIDAHCERARSAGAEIVVEPTDQFYGDRTYRCVDREGHHWTFAQHVRDVSIEEAVAITGMSITATNWP